MKKILAPSILSADFSNLAQQIRYAEIGGADWIHCDIMDGQFVPNITFGPMIVKTLDKLTDTTLDVHLMIKDAGKYIEHFINAGADYVTIHQEAVTHLEREINRIKELGAKAGVTINPSTPVSVLSEVLKIVDMVLIMSVNPGFGGQSFIENSIDKIRDLDRLRKENDYSYLIEVDGGINTKNIQKVSEAGCDVFVIGSSIFNSNNITAATVEFKNILSE
jgi:ribulose-phosphate 3-epimerase